MWWSMCQKQNLKSLLLWRQSCVCACVSRRICWVYISCSESQHVQHSGCPVSLHISLPPRPRLSILSTSPPSPKMQYWLFLVCHLSSSEQAGIFPCAPGGSVSALWELCSPHSAFRGFPLGPCLHPRALPPTVTAAAVGPCLLDLREWALTRCR